MKLGQVIEYTKRDGETSLRPHINISYFWIKILTFIVFLCMTKSMTTKVF